MNIGNPTAVKHLFSLRIVFLTECNLFKDTLGGLKPIITSICSEFTDISSTFVDWLNHDFSDSTDVTEELEISETADDSEDRLLSNDLLINEMLAEMFPSSYSMEEQISRDGGPDSPFRSLKDQIWHV